MSDRSQRVVEDSRPW